MKLCICFLSLALLFSLPVSAVEVLETFAARDAYASGDAIWNQALGKIHPYLQVVNYHGLASATPQPFSIGDGSHGAFEPSTYSQFSVNGDISGNKIRFDLSRYPILNVTSFYLAAGWVLEPVGDAPLIIYSLTTVRIEGEIWCHGENGTNAVGATPGSGGAGRCGGKSGGQGGAVGGDGTDGTSVTASVTGGKAGLSLGTTVAVGGGGGGAWNGSGIVGHGPNRVGTNGQAGTSFSDPEFVMTAGGAGGGGGSGNTTDAGAGGGGGGGTVIIHSVGDVSVGTAPGSTTGFIFASGGVGGNSDVNGGPGGGGGGGSIQIFSGGTVYMYNNDAAGAAQADFGAGGSNAVPEGGASGGNGRAWVASVDYQGVGGGHYSPTEETPVVADLNTVEFSAAQQSIILKPIDLLSTMATIQSITVSPSSTDFQVQLRGSADNFQSDDTGWTSNPADVSNKRYVKMKLLITTSTPAAPTMIDQVSMQFVRGEKKDFDFKSTGCGWIQQSSPPNIPTGLVMLALFALPLCLLIWRSALSSSRLVKKNPGPKSSWSFL